MRREDTQNTDPEFKVEVRGDLTLTDRHYMSAQVYFVSVGAAFWCVGVVLGYSNCEELLQTRPKTLQIYCTPL